MDGTVVIMLVAYFTDDVNELSFFSRIVIDAGVGFKGIDGVDCVGCVGWVGVEGFVDCWDGDDGKTGGSCGIVGPLTGVAGLILIGSGKGVTCGCGIGCWIDGD